MKKSRIIAILLALLLVLSTINTSEVQAASVKVSRIIAKNSITGQKSVVVAKGKFVKIKTKVNVKPNKSANKKVIFKSANKKIATVNSKGVIKGIKAGKTKITVISKKNKKKKVVIKVTVKKSAVKSVKVKKPASGTIYVGSTLKLTASVKGKKSAYKKPFWSTSNKKIAKVNQKGVVTALKAGTVKITAKAVDGSGKRSTVTLKIIEKSVPSQKPAPKSKPINIISVSVINPQNIQFKLSEAKILTIKYINIMRKKFFSGAYKNKVSIGSVSTKDNVNYNVVLGGFDTIKNRDYVQVSIPSLSGVKTKEAQYNEPSKNYNDEYVICLKVDESVETSYSDADFQDAIYDFFYENGLSFTKAEGYYSPSITGLPEGVNAKMVRGKLVLGGTPTKAGVTAGTFKAEDEMGNTITKKIIFVVGSSKEIFAATKTAYNVPGAESSVELKASGGSGNYIYEFASEPPENCYISEDSCFVRGKFNNPGTYKVDLIAKDEKDETIQTTFTVTFVIKDSVDISGKITDMKGNTIGSAFVAFICTDATDENNMIRYYLADKDGNYKARIYPGNYEIEVSYSKGNSDKSNVIKHIYSQKFVASASNYDIKLPLNKVNIMFPKECPEDLKLGDWKHANGDTYGGLNTLVLKNGTYSLSNTFAGNWYEFKEKILTAKFTVSNNEVSVLSTLLPETVPVEIKGDIQSGIPVAGLTDGSDNNYAVYRLKAAGKTKVAFTDNRKTTHTAPIRAFIYDNTDKKLIYIFDGDGSFTTAANHEYYVKIEAYPYIWYSYTYNFTFKAVNE